ncbi:sugar ABC transporter ATP-binding protein [Pararobbsia silviterrae]|uniref:Sugar ABC transporter ATP-binding protein n=1 Tax=Pararobbsia silviterrae TaxID=1792498 RepID=A0A494XJR3_9BURK|nr:sugar ABC transporter ATP-binding protein [Pararobbsia silviterrae]RKP47803.1 sugar ABC transporter ATP-binding protein [Pararobbsia silviterrae]
MVTTMERVNGHALDDPHASPSPHDPDIVLALRGITRRFPGVTALNEVALDVRKNEILGLLGENGAGKSVLTKIMTGIYQPDEGTLSLHGKRVTIRGTADAIKKGIGVVFQEGSLIPNLSVMENLFLRHEDPFLRFGALSRRAMAAEARRRLEQMNLDVDVDAPVSSISAAAKQMVEIARVLWLSEKYGASNPIVILDEPTTVLNDAERGTLFEILNRLKHRASIILISHRLQEVLENCDRVVVLKDGVNVTETRTEGLAIAEVEKLLVGNDYSGDRFRESDQRTPDGPVTFRVDNLSKAGAFDALSFAVREGEIVSLVGLVGSGKEALCRCIAGLDRFDSGSVTIDGASPVKASSRSAVLHGIGHVPIERREEGLALNMSVADNINYLVLDKLKKGGLINRAREREHARQWVAECLVKTPSIDAACRGLSGGNQQKVILSKWLSSDVKLLILDHPTRGIDIKAKDEVYRLIRKFAKAGIAMLIMCDTLEEDIGLANRILVMRERKLVGELDAPPGAKPTPHDLITMIV